MLSQSAHERLYGKTGWRFRSSRNPDNGWFVGWVERVDGRALFFALNVEPASTGAPNPLFASSRRGIVEAALQEMGWRSE